MIADFMTRDTFSLLKSNIAFGKVVKGAADSKLFKIQNVYDLVQQQLRDPVARIYRLSIDEKMVAFKGRLPGKQYMRDKKNDWRSKWFVGADSVTGYPAAFVIYSGADTQYDDLLPRNEKGLVSGWGTPYDAVLSLVIALEDVLKYPNKDGLLLTATIFWDNWYTTLPLVILLYFMGYGVIGTVLKRCKGIPTDFWNLVGPNRGDWFRAFAGPITVTCWRYHCKWLSREKFWFICSSGGIVRVGR